MREITGKYNTAIAYLDNLEKCAAGQLKALCDQEFCSGSTLRIMPDAHGGKGCVIGTTMTIHGKISPNMVGVDIGCGMETIRLGDIPLDFEKLDRVIRSRVPSGTNIRSTPHPFTEDLDFRDMSCRKKFPEDRAYFSLGTLGGGNHFIEIDRDQDSRDYYLVIHSGSRNPGLQIANYHQKIAMDRKLDGVPDMLAYLEGEQFDNYVHDMKKMQDYALLNRKAMAAEIMEGMGWKELDSFPTIHNYLDTEHMILRKGAVSAQAGEPLLIPLNMRDGALLCEGLGNADWNYSAPHGAGRLFSRTAAKKNLNLEEFKKEMKGIYSTCIHPSTLDESPMAYKPIEDILSHIDDTVKVKARLVPVYNFKAPA